MGLIRISTEEHRARREAERAANLRNLANPNRSLHRGSYGSGSASGIALPKSEPKRNPVLLAMAKDEGCLLRVEGVCNRDRATTVACHSNWSEHGKAGSRKADDCYTVWGCSSCHAWLDQGKADQSFKRRVWDCAFEYQRDIWLQSVSGLLDSTPTERKAADWALKEIARHG